MQHAIRTLTPALLSAILLAGCVSTQKRYEKGLKYENSGRYEQAAGMYLRVLQKEPHREEARAHLQDVGGRIVDASLDQANALEDVGQYDQAVQALDKMDVLRSRVAAVGISLDVPDDYEDYRSSLRTGAVNELIDRGRRAEETGDFAAALNAYERAEERYDLPDAQRQDLRQARLRVLTNWSEADLASGRFRSAYARAEQILQIAGPDASQGRHARSLQEDALRRGTLPVAYLPVTASASVADQAPRGFQYSLSEALQYDRWGKPPLFLAPAPPDVLNRELRRVDYDRGSLSVAQAVSVGAGTGAALVVLPELARYDRVERVGREQSRTAHTKGRGATEASYVVQQYRLELHAEVGYRIIDPRTRAVLNRGTIEASVDDELTRGVYSGNWRDLDLSSSARELFEGEAQDRAEHDLEGQLIDRLSVNLANRVQPLLLQRVP